MSGKTYGNLKTGEPAPGVLKVTLSRPERLNAMNDEMIDDLLRLSEEILAGYPECYRAVVMCGEGRSFSSGGDIRYFQTLLGKPRNLVEAVLARFHSFARIWYELPLPTIAAVSGTAAGGGAGLALLCDLRLASPDARIGFPFVNIGLIPDYGCHYLLPALVGRQRALELLYSGDFVGAEDAVRMGLFTRIVPRDGLETEAVAVAEKLAGKPSDVLRTIKDLTRESGGMSFSQVLDREVAGQARRFASPEFADRVRSFLEKT